MYPNKSIYILTVAYIFIAFSYSCKNETVVDSPLQEKEIVATQQEMEIQVNKNIKEVLQYAMDNKGKINDSLHLLVAAIVDSFYNKNQYEKIWSKNEAWEPIADSLYNFIANAEAYGLFPSDYHYKELQILKTRLIADTAAKSDATVWTKAELLLSDAFMQISKHLKQGRLMPDSISLSANSTLANSFFIKNLNTVIESRALTSILNSLEPRHAGYVELKIGIKKFIDSMDRTVYTYIVYPDKDSLAFIRKLKKRLREGNYFDDTAVMSDSLSIAKAVKNYQRYKRIKPDGKITPSLVRSLNANDTEKFKRIAINIDRYKQLPDELPDKYVWVNIPGYYLRLIDNDTIVLESKVIVGKPSTRTPKLNSYISDMITYPQWTIPNSIIKNEILPAMKKNAGYLTRKGFHLVDIKGETVDPWSVNWNKYTKGIPYKIVQGSGDENALGIFKFNFNNPYNVYLHDTNQRYLFKNKARALSHGCVRVQDWEKLAFYIAKNDSLKHQPGNPPAYNSDSIKTWLGNKERKRMVVKNRIPLSIRYFTCDQKNGRIIFYDDIYGEDKILREKYFAGR